MKTTDSLKKDPLMWICFIFLLLALSFVFDFWGELDKKRGESEEIKKTPTLNHQLLASKTVREPAKAPILRKEPFLYSCQSCHQLFPKSRDADSFQKNPQQRFKQRVEHEDLVLKHGENARCFHCHAEDDRNFLVNRSQEKIPFQESERLCQECHGLIFRDWEKGIHGRPFGSWKPSEKGIQNVTCVACHDPHSPKFKPIKPAPGPKYLNHALGASKENHKKKDEK